ncbi:MAG: hypothetical protein WAN43_15910 [Rhodomicrobium sp.]|jgi:hypothetical protein
MRLPAILFFIASSLAIALPAAARDCPAAGREEKLAFVAAAPSCQEAARRFRRCAIGARLDGDLALRVNDVCEKAWLSHLRGPKRAAYEAAIGACNAPYAARQGSMSRSAAAHCRVDVMAEYAKGH